jgi:hypothetical protein
VVEEFVEMFNRHLELQHAKKGEFEKESWKAVMTEGEAIQTLTSYGLSLRYKVGEVDQQRRLHELLGGQSQASQGAGTAGIKDKDLFHEVVDEAREIKEAENPERVEENTDEA